MARKVLIGSVWKGFGEDPRAWLSRLERMRSENSVSEHNRIQLETLLPIAKLEAEEYQRKLLETRPQ